MMRLTLVLNPPPNGFLEIEVTLLIGDAQMLWKAARDLCTNHVVCMLMDALSSLVHLWCEMHGLLA